MKNYEGTLEMGDASTNDSVGYMKSTYSYVTVGDATLRGLVIKEGLDGKLREASRRGERVKLFVFKNHVLAAQFSDGRVFGSDWRGVPGALYVMPVIMFVLVMLLITAPFAIAMARAYGINWLKVSLDRKTAEIGDAVLI
mgnify:CR=1 FL=1